MYKDYMLVEILKEILANAPRLGTYFYSLVNSDNLYTSKYFTDF